MQSADWLVVGKHLWQQLFGPFQTIELKKFAGIAPLQHVEEGHRCIGLIDGNPTSQIVKNPPVAAERLGGTPQPIRVMLLEPCKHGVGESCERLRAISAKSLR